MPKKVAHNCFQCSKLSHDEAQTKSCWDATRCPNRRHYQRNKERISQQRRSLKSQTKLSDHTEKTTANQPRTIEIAHPIGTAASIIFYRERQDAPVHALAAEVWQGSNKVLAVHPIHCLGLSPAQLGTQESLAALFLCQGESRDCRSVDPQQFQRSGKLDQNYKQGGIKALSFF